MRTPDSALNTIWRNTGDGRAVLLRITPAGLAALGGEADSAPLSGPVAEGGTQACPDSYPAGGRLRATRRRARGGRGRERNRRS
jgi:hypothetical protein